MNKTGHLLAPFKLTSSLGTRVVLVAEKINKEAHKYMHYQTIHTVCGDLKQGAKTKIR